MKKILFVLMLLVTFSSYAQVEIPEPSEKKNEVYLNAFNIVAFKWLDMSYERILNEESSIGISLLTNLGDNYDGYDNRNYSITPYYRHFFSKKYAQGFFLETFLMANGGEDDYYDYYNGQSYYYDEEYFDIAVGIGLGGKFVSKRGFVGEIHAGIGRNLINGNNNDEEYYYNDHELVGRSSISIGYRF